MIYLDHHAATPLCDAAVAAMRQALDADLGNPSSAHAAGRAARSRVERAREQVAAAIGGNPPDVVFTSGGTESCTLGVLGAIECLQVRGGHVVTTSVEHPAVAAPIARLEGQGLAVTRLAVAEGIAPDAAALEQVLTNDTRLCAVQWVNHETGTVFPVAEYARVCRARGIPLFVDATQAAGKLALDVSSLDADFVALAAHKIGGPAGAGALWARRGAPLAPVMLGGAQERGRRAGTPDVLALIGFGAACTQLAARLAEQARLGALRDQLSARMQSLGFTLNATGGERVSTVVNASLPNARGPELVAALDLEGVCVSSGAACSSGLAAPSPVLLAMHAQESWRASGALRFSFGPETRDSDVESALDALTRVLARAA